MITELIITLLMTSVALVVAGVATNMTMDLYETYKTENMLFEQDSSTKTQTQR